MRCLCAHTYWVAGFDHWSTSKPRTEESLHFALRGTFSRLARHMRSPWQCLDSRSGLPNSTGTPLGTMGSSTSNRIMPVLSLSFGPQPSHECSCALLWEGTMTAVTKHLDRRRFDGFIRGPAVMRCEDANSNNCAYGNAEDGRVSMAVDGKRFSSP